MVFGSGFSEEEVKELDELHAVYDRLISASPSGSTSAPRGTADDPAVRQQLRRLFVPPDGAEVLAGRKAVRSFPREDAWRTMMREVNGEVVLRGGQNIRNARSVINRIMSWTLCFSQGEALFSEVGLDISSTGLLRKVWIDGVTEYFLERMEKDFAELDMGIVEEACRRNIVDSEERDAAYIPYCVASARTVITPTLLCSPCFLRLIRCCRELTVALWILKKLLEHLSSSGFQTGAPRFAQAPDSRHHSILASTDRDERRSNPLHDARWLFRLVLLFLGGMELQQQSDAARVAALSEKNLDASIHCIASLVGDAVSCRNGGSDTKAEVRMALDGLVLHHIKSRCISTFPPGKASEVWRSHPSGDAVESLGAEPPETLLARSAELVRRVLVDYAAFMGSVERFAARNELREWGVSLMTVQLFCWDPAVPLEMRGSPAQHLSYHLPHPDGSFSVQKTALYAMMRELLRPLLYVLLGARVLEDGHGGDASAIAPAAVTSAMPSLSADRFEHEAANTSRTSPTGLSLSPLEQKVCAILLALADWMSTIVLPPAAGMSQWDALHVGKQVTREFKLGTECFVSVVSDVLGEVVEHALSALQSQHHDAAVATSTEEDEAASSALHTEFVRYLWCAERIWNILTTPRIVFDRAAFENLTAMGAVLARPLLTEDRAQTSPDAAAASTYIEWKMGPFCEHKALFYDTVVRVMKLRFSSSPRDPISEPLLRSIHRYMIRAEAKSTRGVREEQLSPAAVAGRQAPAVALPRQERGTAASTSGASGARQPSRLGGGGRPEAIPLISTEDFHGALRLVRCIVDRDYFIACYTAQMQRRLLLRPRVQSITDNELEATKKRVEREAEQFLTEWLSDPPAFKPVRDLYTTYTIQSKLFKSLLTPSAQHTAATTAAGMAAAASPPAKDFRLTTTILDWKQWGKISAEHKSKTGAAGACPADRNESPASPPTFVPGLSAWALQVHSTPTSDTAPLLFPLDILPYLSDVEEAYENKNSMRALQWDWNEYAYTSFTLLYPKEKGRPITVHATLLWQRLLMTVAAYGRAGVQLETLAKRAGLKTEKLFKILMPCLRRDKLLVQLDESGSGAAVCSQLRPLGKIALNYEFERPAQNPRGEYVYWPNYEGDISSPPQILEQVEHQRQEVLRTSIIQVMKQAQRIAHKELYEKVREKHAKTFDLAPRFFKQQMEDLIQKDYIERCANSDEYLYRS